MASSHVENQSEMLSYEAVFVENPDRKYVCPVCLIVMRDAVQTSCGHRFCETCILTVANRSGMCKCPIDNTWFKIVDELFPDIAVRREILSLKVKCQQLDNGCRWTGELRDLDTHIMMCDYATVMCQHGCSEVSLRRVDIPRHLLTCELRPVSCEHCNSSTTSVDLTRHQLLDCRKFPVVCSLCGKSGINREDILCHLNQKSGDCQRVIIACPYERYGCQFAGRREIMTCHEKEATHIHLSCMADKIMSQEKRITNLENQLQQLVGLLNKGKTTIKNVTENP